jgi:hypothetical protein
LMGACCCSPTPVIAQTEAVLVLLPSTWKAWPVWLVKKSASPGRTTVLEDARGECRCRALAAEQLSRVRDSDGPNKYHSDPARRCQLLHGVSGATKNMMDTMDESMMQSFHDIRQACPMLSSTLRSTERDRYLHRGVSFPKPDTTLTAGRPTWPYS